MSERQYHDIDGNPVSLLTLVREEPEWAVSCGCWYKEKPHE